MSMMSVIKYFESVKNAFPYVYGHFPKGALTDSIILYSFLNMKSSSTKYGIIMSKMSETLVSPG